ncbi:hypothetical protein B0H16DRAFT_1862411 [Mycena metata]|uniref:NmrA-like domain-containing protein n=1 Tax=Mycena metata TaxID=1033252 RepID=A0AAD7N1D9_9AGAR|nr:hypothetical protein B0H16DRAFT_1862411 [Mycena metata]
MSDCPSPPASLPRMSPSFSSRALRPKPPSGVQFVQVETSDIAAVTAVLKEHKVEVVISTINASTPENAAAQKPAIDAAKAAAVKLYVPSEFGCPSEGHTEGSLGAKNKNAEYAKSVGLPSVRIYTGLFTDYIPLLTGYNTNGKIRVIGKGEAPVSFTALSDITGFVVHALTTLPASELENRTFPLEGDRATLKELATKFNTSVDHVDSVPGAGGDFIAHLLKVLDAGSGTSRSSIQNLERPIRGREAREREVGICHGLATTGRPSRRCTTCNSHRACDFTAKPETIDVFDGQ